MTRIKLAEPDIGPEAEALVLATLRSGHIAQGPLVERLEELSAVMAGTAHAVAFANGTLALEATVRAMGIGEGDEVITTPFTFVATVNAILASGATVVFADIGGDLNIDPGSVAAAVTDRTAAIMPVHLFGLPADLEALQALVRQHGLVLIEDAAQAHGASFQGKPVGGFGVGVFSFYATKNIAAGEGGVVTTSDPEVARSLRLQRNHGMRARYEYETIGSNLRMTDIHAAVAIPQLERISEIVTRRNENARHLIRMLREAEGVGLPQIPPGRTHVWHQFTVLLPDGSPRSRVIEEMSAAGIQVGVYYPEPIWAYPPYREHPLVRGTDTPNATAASRRCLSLPVHPGLDEADLDRVAKTFLEVLDRHR